MIMTHMLVTGGCGFIGRHLVRRLLAEGRHVTVLDDFSTGLPNLLPDHPGLSLVQGCATDGAAVRAAARDARVIFHLASVVGQINVCRAPDWTVRVSTESVRQLNLWAPDALLVLFSSSAVYGLTSDGFCSEDDPPDEPGILAYDGGSEGYAFGKFRSEQIGAERAPGTLLAVRPFNVVGPGQRGTYGMVVPRFVRSALAGEPVTLYGDGEQTRSFGGVETFVDHLLRLVETWGAGGRDITTFNIGNRTETTINALVDTVERVLNLRVDRRYVPYSHVYPGKSDVRRRRPLLERIEALLGPLRWPVLGDTIARVAASLDADAKAGTDPRLLLRAE
jgi:UDP-glucose 4-epimerase